tara:strand:- start:162 stop:611 length:450 start_codon:yes stop_codon:yes gene_type:complete
MNQYTESKLDLLTGMLRENISLNSMGVDHKKLTMAHLKNDDILVNNPYKEGIFSFFTNFSNTSEGGEKVSYDIYDAYYDDDDKLCWQQRDGPPQSNLQRDKINKPILAIKGYTYNLARESSDEYIYFLDTQFLEKNILINWNQLPWGGK